MAHGLAMSLGVALATSIPDPEQLDHRAPIPTQEEPVAASRADRLTDLPTLEELLATATAHERELGVRAA